MIAKSIRVQTLSELEAYLDESKVNGFSPTLAICMVSIKQDLWQFLKIMSESEIEIFGITSNGEFIDENLGEGSAAIMFLDIDKEYFDVYIEEFQDRNYRESGHIIAKKSLTSIKNPSFFISSSNMETDAEQILHGFEDIVGDDVKVFGGLSGDDFSFQKQFVFTNGKMYSNGLIALALDSDKIEIIGRATCGWKAMGVERTVTKSEGNHVFTIDNVPVMEMTAKYGGFDLEKGRNQDDFVVEIATMCPLQLIKENGEMVMRPGLVIDWNDLSYFSSGTVPEGSKVKFSLPPDFDAIEEVIQGCKELKETMMPEADAVVYFTCAGRLMTFGPLMSQEIEGIKSIWNAPMVGMFSNAEIGRSKGGKLELHNLTSCCVVLKEKEL